MENIEQEVTDAQTTANNHNAELEVNVSWKSPLFENNQPFLNEHTTITVHPVENAVRKIDFEITLKALVPGIEIGGSDDEKGYGGLCARLKLPDDLTFTSASGPVIPQTLQINAGAWMDFSSSFNGSETCGVSIFCHPKTPNYPAPWILRPKTSMQNVVFPGQTRIKIPTDESVVLYYRLVVHNGNAGSIDLDKMQSDYGKTSVRQ
jgi:hypothetical protein